MKNTTIKLLVIAGFLGAGATGCATTKVTQKTAAAPITYKMGQGNAQYAAIALPKRAPRTALPRYETPEPVAPRGGQTTTFDQASVDNQLYKHQKVGKRYTIMGRSYTPKHQPDYDVEGMASWYGPNFHGKPTATGETFNKRDLTAAHKTLPLNSMLFVTNLENGRTLTVRLNDRGPFIGDRILDLSEASAEALGMKHQGKARVRVQYAGPADPMAVGRDIARMAPQPVPMPEENMVQAPLMPAPVIPAPYIPAPIAPAPLPFVPAEPEWTAPAPIAPSQPKRAPEADLPSGGDVTLTIKGPIHIARSDASTQPRWISERLQTR